MPAPFGPIRLVTLPGAARERHLARRPHAAEGDADVPLPARRACGAGELGLAGDGEARLAPAREPAFDAAPTTPSGASHSTTSSSAPKKSSRYSASAARNSGSSTTIAAPTSGPATEPAPPMITTSTNRIDCENAKVDGVTKPDSAAKNAPATPAQNAEMAKAAVLMRTGSRPIDSAAISESFTARIAAPQRLLRQEVETTGGKRRQHDARDGDRALAVEQRRLGDAHDAVLPAGHAAPFDRDVLDDEAESDGHHREVRAAHAHRRQREQRAGRRASSAATGSASQKFHFTATVSTATV